MSSIVFWKHGNLLATDASDDSITLWDFTT